MNTRALVVIGLLCLLPHPGPLWAQAEEASGDPPSSDETPLSEWESSEPTADAGGGAAGEIPAAAPAQASDGTAPADGHISMDFKEADIRQVLRIIALKSGVDIVAGTDVEGLVTIKLTNVPWEEALDIILRTYGFTYERKRSIIRVMTLAALEEEALATEVFPLDYAKAKEVPDVITEMLSERGRVKYDERTNTVIVTDVPTTLFQIREVIERLDQRTPQVMIETKIVETKLEKDENLGIRWSDSFTVNQTQTSYPSSFPFLNEGTLGTFGDNFVSPALNQVPGPTGLLSANPTSTLGSIGIGTLSSSALALTMNVLKQRSDTKIVSNPTLAVLDNQQAKIHIGEEFPVPNFSVDPSTGKTTVSGFQTKSIGTVLTVTPHVNPSEEVVVDMKPEIISALSNQTFNVGGSESVSLPRFSTQTVTTQVRIRDGETIAIGGLVKDILVSQENKVPVLGDLPLIGLLFTNTHRFGGSSNPTLKQDLLIFLTVTLAKEPPPRQAVASTSLDTP